MGRVGRTKHRRPARIRLRGGRLTPRQSRRVRRCLRRGGVIAYPTEHLYGLACDPAQPRAVTRLFRIKQRARHKPLPLLVGTRADLARVVGRVPSHAAALVRAWPPGLTLVLPAATGWLRSLTATDGSVAVRLPAHPETAAWVIALGGILPATSANRAGRRAPARADRLWRDLPGVDLVMDAGPRPPGRASTLLDVRTQPWRVLRPGAAPVATLARYGEIAGGREGA